MKINNEEYFILEESKFYAFLSCRVRTNYIILEKANNKKLFESRNMKKAMKIAKCL